MYIIEELFSFALLKQVCTKVALALLSLHGILLEVHPDRRQWEKTYFSCLKKTEILDLNQISIPKVYLSTLRLW